MALQRKDNKENISKARDEYEYCSGSRGHKLREQSI
jgi:hypothetical protein